MSQNEKDDYDDERFGPILQRNPYYCQRAGLHWMIAWVWLLIGVTLFFGFAFFKSFSHAPILFLMGHLIFAGLFILGADLVRGGKVNLLGVISIGSVFVGVIYGLGGFLLGILMMIDFIESPPIETRIMGGVFSTFALGFMVWGFVALFQTFRYALYKSDPKTWTHRPKQGTPNNDAI